MLGLMMMREKPVRAETAFTSSRARVTAEGYSSGEVMGIMKIPDIKCQIPDQYVLNVKATINSSQFKQGYTGQAIK
jgi:hypothetical protein